MLKHAIIAVCALTFTAAVAAKLPALTPEQQAAAALNAAKSAHAGKVDAYALCMSQTKVADAFIKEQKAKGVVFTPEATPPCVNPGAFVPPADAAPAVAAAPAQSASAKPAPAAAKK